MPTATAPLVWADPAPARKGPAGYLAKFVEQLKERPGEWAICEPAQKYATEAYKRNVRYPGTEWAARRNDDGLYVMHARWVGDPPAEGGGAMHLTKPC